MGVGAWWEMCGSFLRGGGWSGTGRMVGWWKALWEEGRGAGRWKRGGGGL